MTTANLVAGIIVLGITLYAWSGLADFGAGFWDFIAGAGPTGRRARALIDEVITPVWEANHVWLIYILIVTWTAFGVAFGAIMTTLFVPFALAALGIVLRGSNFALRKDAARAGGRQWAGWLFGVGSILTPFFFGASLGAILSGRVSPNGVGNPASAWVNSVSITVGILTVAVSAFVSAAYLVVECERRGVPELRDYFRTRAVVAGIAAVLAGLAAAIALYIDDRRMFDRLTARSIPLLVLGLLALAAAFFMAVRGVARGLRVVAAIGVAALVWAWAVAQYPYLLPFRLTISAGAGASASLKWLLGWFVVALVTVIPLLILLYTLDQRGHLGEDPTTSRREHRRPGELAVASSGDAATAEGSTAEGSRAASSGDAGSTAEGSKPAGSKPASSGDAGSTSTGSADAGDGRRRGGPRHRGGPAGDDSGIDPRHR